MSIFRWALHVLAIALFLLAGLGDLGTVNVPHPLAALACGAAAWAASYLTAPPDPRRRRPPDQ